MLNKVIIWVVSLTWETPLGPPACSGGHTAGQEPVQWGGWQGAWALETQEALSGEGHDGEMGDPTLPFSESTHW